MGRRYKAPVAPFCVYRWLDDTSIPEKLVLASEDGHPYTAHNGQCGLVGRYTSQYILWSVMGEESSNLATHAYHAHLLIYVRRRRRLFHIYLRDVLVLPAIPQPGEGALHYGRRLATLINAQTVGLEELVAQAQCTQGTRSEVIRVLGALWQQLNPGHPGHVEVEEEWDADVTNRAHPPGVYPPMAIWLNGTDEQRFAVSTRQRKALLGFFHRHRWRWLSPRLTQAERRFKGWTREDTP